MAPHLALLIAGALWWVAPPPVEAGGRRPGPGRQHDSGEVPPLLMTYKGCSMSSCTFNVGRALLEAHTGKVVNAGDGEIELLRLQNNRMANESYGLKTIAQAVDAQITSAKYHGEVFFSKLESYKLVHSSEPDLMEVLRFHGAQVVNTYRSNALDFLVCLIRDCFAAKKLGTPVLEDGTPTELCFARRQEGSPRVLARIDIGELPGALARLSVHASLQARGLRDNGFDNNYDTIATEDLMSFSLSESGMATSVAAWSRFLRSLGVQPIKHVIHKVLKGRHLEGMTAASCGREGHNACQPGAHPLSPHADVIFNFEEVADTLRRLGNETYLGYVRGRDTAMPIGSQL